MCSDCRESNLKRKAEQFEEPRPMRRGTRKLSEKTAGTKVLLDRLLAARGDLLRAIDWKEDSKGRRDSWMWRDTTWYEKRYCVALRNCWAAGIAVKA